MSNADNANISYRNLPRKKKWIHFASLICDTNIKVMKIRFPLLFSIYILPKAIDKIKKKMLDCLHYHLNKNIDHWTDCIFKVPSS